MTAAALLLAFALAAADAEELASRAHKAEAALDYEEAARFWLEVLALDELPTHRRVEAHLQLASAFVVLEDKEGARFHYRRGLLLDPTADLAPNAPAKARVTFEDVKNELRTVAVEKADRGPWLAGAVALSAGAALGVTAGVLLALAAGAESDALDEDEQLARDALYDRRDGLTLGAWVAGVGALALGGVAVAALSTIGWQALVGSLSAE